MNGGQVLLGPLPSEERVQGAYLSSSLSLSSLELSDTKVYAPYIPARLRTAAHFFKVVVLSLRTETSRAHRIGGTK